MLVSKIKPCTCKIGTVWFRPETLLVCGRLIKQVMNLATWLFLGITLSTAAIMPVKEFNCSNTRLRVKPAYSGTLSLLTIEHESRRL